MAFVAGAPRAPVKRRASGRRPRAAIPAAGAAAGTAAGAAAVIAPWRTTASVVLLAGLPRKGRFRLRPAELVAAGGGRRRIPALTPVTVLHRARVAVTPCAMRADTWWCWTEKTCGNNRDEQCPRLGTLDPKLARASPEGAARSLLLQKTKERIL